MSGNRNSENEKQAKAEKGLSHGGSPFLTSEAGPTGGAVSVRLVAEAGVPYDSAPHISSHDEKRSQENLVEMLLGAQCDDGIDARRAGSQEARSPAPTSVSATEA